MGTLNAVENQVPELRILAQRVYLADQQTSDALHLVQDGIGEKMNDTEQDKVVGRRLSIFWNEMFWEQNHTQGYCEASCFKAEYFDHLGFWWHYGDGVYARSAKGQYWQDHPSHVGTKEDKMQEWYDLARRLRFPHDEKEKEWFAQVVAECLEDAERA